MKAHLIHVHANDEIKIELICFSGTLYRGMVPVLESLCCSNFVYFYTFHGLKSVSGRATQQNAGRDLMLAAVAGKLVI